MSGFETFSASSGPDLSGNVSIGGTLTLTAGGIILPEGATLQFGGPNRISYVDGTGLTIRDAATLRTLTLNLQSLTVNRSVTVPDITGTMTVT